MPKKKEKTEKKTKHPGGRPSSYNQKIADLICYRVATHDCGLPRLCQMYKDMPHEDTVRAWRLENAEFSSKYARAKMLQADILAEECLTIADESTPQNVNVDRLRIDTRKWLASKLLPKQYGDKLLLEQKTEENDKLKMELLALRAELDERNKKDY